MAPNFKRSRSALADQLHAASAIARLGGHVVAGARTAAVAEVKPAAFEADRLEVSAAGAFRLVLCIDLTVAALGTCAQFCVMAIDLDDMSCRQLGVHISSFLYWLGH